MKKYFFLLFLISIITLPTAYSQTAHYSTLVTYNTIITFNEHPSNKTYLYINDTSSYYIEPNMQKSTINIDDISEEEMMSGSIDLGTTHFSEDIGYYKNFNQNTMWYNTATLKSLVSFNKKTVQEPLPFDIKWQIESETKTIANTYHCQKAIGEFRGRTYTVWFTPQIPVSNGPWKLGGLPGLILEAYDDDKEIIFEFKSLQNVDDTIDININKKEAISRAEYITLLKKSLKSIQEKIAFMTGRNQSRNKNVTISTFKVNNQIEKDLENFLRENDN